VHIDVDGDLRNWSIHLVGIDIAASVEGGSLSSSGQGCLVKVAAGAKSITVRL
jgi:hypothetical protein